MSSLTLRHWLTLLCTLALISILANVLYNAQLAPASPRRPDTNAKVAQLPPQQQQQQQQQQQINDIDDRGGESSSELAAFESSVALATIAYGDEARQFALNLLRSVAANVHGSVGGVVVLTDDAEFFRSANYGLHVVDVVFLQAPASELPSVPTSAKLSSRRAAKLGIKWLKTQLFKRIDARFRHVVYLDADVVVGAPLRDFMSLAFSLKSTAVLGAFPDSGNTGSPFHTGVLFASRGRSEPLLERWAAAILGGRYQGDQKALADVVAELRLDDAIDRFPLDGGLVRLKHADAYFAFVDATVVRKSRKVIFLHTSKYRLENPLKFGVSLADLRLYMKRVCGIAWDIDVPSVDGHDQSTKLALAAPVDRRQNNNGEQAPAPANDGMPNADNTAIVSIAVGEKSRAFARLLIRSFQLHSEFAGPLYIATDDVDYFKTEAPDLSETGDDDDDSAKRRERRAENFARRNYALAPNVRFLLFGNGTCEQLPLPDVAVHMKKLTPEEIAKKAKGVKSKADFTNSLEAAPQAEGGGGSGNEKELLNSHNRERLQIKWLKTQFFRMLPRQYAFALFMDSDMIIERPLRHLLDDCFAVYRRTPQPPVITLYKDFGNTGMPYHTGVLFMSRADSQPLLDRWGDVILNGWTKSDQKCINQTINELGLTERVGFLDIDKDNFAFINGSVINGGAIVTLLHATFYRLSMADKFDFTREAFAYYLKQKVQLTAVGAVLELVPDAAEVERRQTERARQLKKGVRECKYLETSWHRYVIQWCP